MKKILTTIIVVLLVLAAVAPASAQTDDPIPSIRQHYAQINRNAARYRKVKKNLSGFSEEGGTLVAYFDGPNIMKIAANYYGEGGKSYEEYYYGNGKLIFVLRRDYQYNKPLSGKVVRTTENRFYFKHDQMIRWIDENGKQVATDTSEYAEKQKDYLDSSKQLSAGARSRKRTIESN